MDENTKDLFRRHRVYLLNNVDYNDIGDHLIQEGVVNGDKHEFISSGTTTKDKMRNFLDRLSFLGPNAFSGFCKSLEECDVDYTHVLEKLRDSPSDTNATTTSCDEPDSKRFATSGNRTTPALQYSASDSSVQSPQLMQSLDETQLKCVQSFPQQRLHNQSVPSHTRVGPTPNLTQVRAQRIPASQLQSLQSDDASFIQKNTSIQDRLQHNQSSKKSVYQSDGDQCTQHPHIQGGELVQQKNGQHPNFLGSRELGQQRSSNQTVYQNDDAETSYQYSFGQQSDAGVQDNLRHQVQDDLGFDDVESGLLNNQSNNTVTPCLTEGRRVVYHAENDSLVTDSSTTGSDDFPVKEMQDLSIGGSTASGMSSMSSNSSLSSLSNKKSNFLEQLTTQQRKHIPSDMLFGMIAPNIPAIDTIGACLDINSSKVDQFKNSNQYNIQAQAIKLFCHWRNNNGNKATLEKFIKALNRAKIDDTLYEEEVKEYLAELSESEESS